LAHNFFGPIKVFQLQNVDAQKNIQNPWGKSNEKCKRTQKTPTQVLQLEKLGTPYRLMGSELDLKLKG